MRVRFLGAAGTVTGSKYLVESAHARVLVDCGLFQGRRDLRRRNREPLEFDASGLDAVVLTHAHIDHSGYIPALVRAGFSGPVISTTATRDLCAILLPDSGHLQEEEARYLNRRRKHDTPVVPLYDREEAEASLSSFQPVPFGTTGRIGDLEIRFTPAGHILGSASVRLSDSQTSIAFSGDIGRERDPLMRPPTPVDASDYLVMESTYGARHRVEEDIEASIARIVGRTAERGGIVMVPAFAVGRAQGLLHILARLRQRGEIPDLPTYLNSPMAINTTRLYCEHRAEHRLSEDECRLMCGVAKYVNRVEGSRALNKLDQPAIILSASGMASGGRILHHLKAYLPDPKHSVLFVGFQAGGTRGRRLVDGAASVRIHGDEIPVRAEIHTTDALSAHADADELVAWAQRFTPAPHRTFVTHGEPPASSALASRLERELGWRVTIPEMGDAVEL